MRWKVIGPILGLVVLLVLLGAVVYLLRPPPDIPPPAPEPEPPPVAPALALRPVAAPPVSDDRDAESLGRALERSIEYLRARPPGAPLRFGPDEVPAGRLLATLERVARGLAEQGLSAELLAWLAESFRFYESTADEVVFTGYFLPTLRGSRTRSRRYPHPIYRPPDDLYRIELERFDFFDRFPELPESVNARATEDGRVVPYYTRGEIDFQGALEGRRLEMLYVESLVELHSLHVQGSGVIELDSGERVLIGFADSNGHRFRGVGEVLLSEGLLPRDRVSYREIQSFLKANPQLVERVLSKNARYIFFRQLPGGPQGNLGLEITPHRSIATDQSLFPAAALALIETRLPVYDATGGLAGWRPIRRLVLNQDTGAAIRGPGRVDLYCGAGADNELVAGGLKQPGRLYFLLAPPGPS